MDISLQILAAAMFKNPQTLKTASPPEILMPAEVAARDPLDQKVTISLIRTPRSGMKGLVRIRQQLALELSIGNLLSHAQQLPLCLLADVSFSLYQQRCAEIHDAEDCIEVVETASGKIISPDSAPELLTDVIE